MGLFDRDSDWPLTPLDVQILDDLDHDISQGGDGGGPRGRGPSCFTVVCIFLGIFIGVILSVMTLG